MKLLPIGVICLFPLANLNWCHSCFSSGKLIKGEFVNVMDLELYGFTYDLYPDRVMDRDMLASP